MGALRSNTYSCLICYHMWYHIISYVLSYLVSYHMTWYHIISHHIISCSIISYDTISCHIISAHTISYHTTCNIMSNHIASYRVASNRIASCWGGRPSRRPAERRARGKRLRVWPWAQRCCWAVAIWEFPATSESSHLIWVILVGRLGVPWWTHSCWHHVASDSNPGPPPD